jgi:hypothetical protein
MLKGFTSPRSISPVFHRISLTREECIRRYHHDYSGYNGSYYSLQNATRDTAEVNEMGSCVGQSGMRPCCESMASQTYSVQPHSTKEVDFMYKRPSLSLFSGFKVLQMIEIFLEDKLHVLNSAGERRLSD